jgi:hypothetical protein
MFGMKKMKDCLQLMRITLREVVKMSIQLDELTAQVSKTISTEQAAIAKLQEFTDKLTMLTTQISQGDVVDTQALQGLTDQLKESADKLAAATA